MGNLHIHNETAPGKRTQIKTQYPPFTYNLRVILYRIFRATELLLLPSHEVRCGIFHSNLLSLLKSDDFQNRNAQPAPAHRVPNLWPRLTLQYQVLLVLDSRGPQLLLVHLLALTNPGAGPVLAKPNCITVDTSTHFSESWRFFVEMGI